MKKAIYVLLAGLFVWLIWASTSTGPLYDLEQINPDYPVENKHLAYLVAEYNKEFQPRAIYPMSDVLVRSCSIFMPDWELSAHCVKTSYECAYAAPKQSGFLAEYADIESREFRACKKERMPSMSPVDYVLIAGRSSRAMLRATVYVGAAWSVGLLDAQGEQYSELEKKHKWWLEPIGRWADRGF